MQPLAVDPLILRALVGPDIKIVVGRAMMARVIVANPGGRGSLSIAGYLLEAELPEGVQAGQDLRLVVRDVNPQRVLLSITDDRPASAAPGPAAPDAAPVAVPLPGGGSVAVTERDAASQSGASGGSHELCLRYSAPALGAIDLRLALDPGSLRVTVTVARGEPLRRMQAAAGELRQGLADELRRGVSVTVAGRHEPLDVYA